MIKYLICSTTIWSMVYVFIISVIYNKWLSNVHYIFEYNYLKVNRYFNIITVISVFALLIPLLRLFWILHIVIFSQEKKINLDFYFFRDKNK